MEKRGVDNLRTSLSKSPDDDLIPIGDTCVVHAGVVPIAAYGTSLYGWVDVVPGYLHVRTMFWHFCWLPLMPLQTWILSNDPQGLDHVKNLPVRLSAKSVAFAWLRSLLNIALVGLVLMVLHLLFGLIFFNNLALLGVAGLLLVLVLLALRLLSYMATACEERAIELAGLVGFGPDRFDEIRRALVEGFDEAPEEEPLEVPCPKCGQKVLDTSPICPRCEFRFRSNR